ncbi:hypothetical protein BDF14DRAFT_1766155 [Spinellus fusiger]|nr:hypothetical protein BDF14DRAFT_1766155 [Spinellus fusiger]
MGRDAQWNKDFWRTEKGELTTKTNKRDRGYVLTRYRSQTREEPRNRNKQNGTKRKNKTRLARLLRKPSL